MFGLQATGPEFFEVWLRFTTPEVDNYDLMQQFVSLPKHPATVLGRTSRFLDLGFWPHKSEPDVLGGFSGGVGVTKLISFGYISS